MASASKSTTLYNNNGNGFTLQASFTENSTSVANNTSNITCTAKFTSGNANWSTSYASTLIVYWHDNRENYDRQVASISFAGIGANTTKTASASINVTHKDDGTLSGYAKAVFTKGSTTTSWACNSGSVSTNNTALTTIARASQPSINTWPNNSPDFNIGDTITIHMNRKSTAFTHTVTLTLGTYTYQIATGVTDNCTLNTSTIANNLYQQIPNAKVGTGSISATTYNGSTVIGTKSCTFNAKVVNSNPTFSTSYLDTNSTTTTITGNNQQIIRSNSTLQVKITSASAKNYATLSSAKCVINGTTYNASFSGSNATFNIGTVNLSSNTTATLTVTDSRGISTSKNQTITILDWVLPTAIINLQRENNFYSETNLNVDAEYSSLNNKNTISIKARYKKTADSSWGSYIPLQDSVTQQLTLDNDYAWNFQVVLQDKLGTKTYNLVLDRGIPITFFDKNKRSVGINRFPTESETLEVNGNIIATNKDGSHPCYLKTQYVTTAGTNLNDYVDQGIYFFNQSYIPTNIPTGVNGWLVVMALGEADTTDKFIKQVWLRAGTPNTNDYDMYVRTRSWDGNWGSWRRIITEVDTEWKTLEYTSAFTYYSNAEGNKPKIKKIGNIVYIKGVATPTAQINANQSTTMFTLPSGYYNGASYFVCQGSGMNRWTFALQANGEVQIERYGTTTNSAIPTGVWLPYNISIVID